MSIATAAANTVGLSPARHVRRVQLESEAEKLKYQPPPPHPAPPPSLWLRCWSRLFKNVAKEKINPPANRLDGDLQPFIAAAARTFPLLAHLSSRGWPEPPSPALNVKAASDSPPRLSSPGEEPAEAGRLNAAAAAAAADTFGLQVETKLYSLSEDKPPPAD